MCPLIWEYLEPNWSANSSDLNQSHERHGYVPVNAPKPLVLIILDGWGYAPPSKANAISLARKPNYDRLLAEFPNTLIHTSGRYVGLPTGPDG